MYNLGVQLILICTKAHGYMLSRI